MNRDDGVFFNGAWLRRAVRYGLATLAVLVGLRAIALADVPAAFVPGETLSAKKMNDNFAALNTRLAAVEQASGGAPAGTIIAYGGTTVPAGWVSCDGAKYARVGQYAALFAAIGVHWGYGDNATTFNVPDLRGRFLRAASGGSGHDPDAANRVAIQPGGAVGDDVGSFQQDAFKAHHHTFHDYSDVGLNSGGTRGTNNLLQSLTDDVGGNETRPVNAYVNYLIKY